MLISESKVDYRLSEAGAHTSFEGSCSTGVNLKLRIPVEQEKSLHFEFSAKPTSTGDYKGKISLGEKSWSLYQRMDIQEHLIEKIHSVTLDRQHQWNSSIGNTLHTEDCTFKSLSRRARIGIRLEKNF